MLTPMVTLTDVLSLPALALRGVHVPRPEAPVRWVATSELTDPSPFLEGGELLLSTGLGTQGWDAEWDSYVARLAAVGVAAIGLGTGLTHAGVPEALARACRARDVNLVEVPRRTTFVAISRLTADLLHRREEAAARRATAMQRELTAAAARDGGPDAVLRTLARHLDGGAALVGPDGPRPGARAGTAPPAGLDLAAETARLRRQGSRAAAALDADGATCVLQPVGLDPRPEDYLAAWTAGGLDEGRRGAVTTAVALLGLDAERRRERRATDRRLRARALELLVEGDARTAAVLLAAAQDAPGPAALPPALRVVEAAGPEAALEDGLAALEADGDVPLVARVGEVLRLAAEPDRAAAAAESLARAGLRAGVGAEGGPADGPRAARTARYALAQASATLPVARWDDLVDDGVLALMGDAARAYGEAFLAPLAGRPELRATLQAFLRHHGSRGHVAAELGIHRNTVRHRVAEIEAAIGRSLDDPATRVNAWVALHGGAAGLLADGPADGVSRRARA